VKLDTDTKGMTVGQLRQQLTRVRRAIRKHRDARGNARCWHNDLELYADALPEAKPAGRMTGDFEALLRNCRRYIRRQQEKP
jgi:hypothetical protein